MGRRAKKAATQTNGPATTGGYPNDATSQPAKKDAAVALDPVVGTEAVEVKDTADRGKILVSRRPLQPGDIALIENSLMSMTMGSQVLSLADMQAWVDKFAALSPDERVCVLDLHRDKKAASDGPLASLLGKRGEQVEAFLKIPEGATAADLWRFLRVLEANALESDVAEGRPELSLALVASRLNHSCLPNALRGPGVKEGTVEIRAVRPVAAGEELTITYLPEQFLLSSAADRRTLLKSRYGFECACPRCIGPDTARAFRCPAATCKGTIFANASGEGMAPCGSCNKTAKVQATTEALKAEQYVIETAAEAKAGAEKVAGRLSAALEARNAEAFSQASEAAMGALGKIAAIARSNKQVDGGHHLMAGLAKSAATVRTLLGDSLASTGRTEHAIKMWGLAAGELKEAMDAEVRACGVPREGRIEDLVGLAGVHQRLGQTQDARGCLEEALRAMRFINWAYPPARRQEKAAMQQGVKSALVGMYAEANSKQ